MSVKTYKKGEKKQLTTNLNLSEVHCHGKGCCNKTLVDTELVKLFQKMRNVLGPLTVESGYRCNWHNSLVGGFCLCKLYKNNVLECRVVILIKL